MTDAMGNEHAPGGAPDGGRFVSKGGAADGAGSADSKKTGGGADGKSTADKLTEATKKYSDDPARDLKEMGYGVKNRPSPMTPEEKEKTAKEKASQMATPKRPTEEEFFGEEFSGVKGAAAVEKLLSEKRGHVKGAFTRPEIGDITLAWGNENGGLLHTIQKRDKLLKKGKGTVSGVEMARMIPEIMDNGEIVIDEEGRMGVEHNGFHVAIRPTFYGKKLNWIVTAMEIFDKKKKTE